MFSHGNDFIIMGCFLEQNLVSNYNNSMFFFNYNSCDRNIMHTDYTNAPAH